MDTDAQGTPAPQEKNGKRGRRLATRAQLLDAATNLFLYGDYFSCSVDDIVREAGLRRATFYLHYSSKEEILVDLMRASSQRLDPVYNYFENAKPTLDRVHKFVQVLIRLSKRAKAEVRLFYLASAYDSELLRVRAENRARHIEALGRNLAAFRDTGRPKDIEARRKSEALLLFFQLEQLVFHANFAGDPAIASHIDALADAFAAFVKTYEA